eukprot:1148577-Pelagomonas_calceolata.AAC.9
MSAALSSKDETSSKRRARREKDGKACRKFRCRMSMPGQYNLHHTRKHRGIVQHCIQADVHEMKVWGDGSTWFGESAQHRIQA